MHRSDATPALPSMRAAIPLPADFTETVPGILVAELDTWPPEALDLAEVVREAEGRVS